MTDRRVSLRLFRLAVQGDCAVITTPKALGTFPAFGNDGNEGRPAYGYTVQFFALGALRIQPARGQLTPRYIH